MTAPISNGPTTHGYTTMRDTTDFETNDTTAGTDVGQHETANTNARP